MRDHKMLKRNANFKAAALLIVIISLVSLSFAFVMHGNRGDDHKKGEEIFTFYSGRNNDKYEAVFLDGELKSLSQNGKLLTKDEMKENKDLVYDKLNNLAFKSKGEDKEDFVFHFPTHAFNKQMRELKSDLAPLKNMKIKILKDLDDNFDIPDIEMDEKDFNLILKE